LTLHRGEVDGFIPKDQVHGRWSRVR
jgi:hypothetical protein